MKYSKKWLSLLAAAAILAFGSQMCLTVNAEPEDEPGYEESETIGENSSDDDNSDPGEDQPSESTADDVYSEGEPTDGEDSYPGDDLSDNTDNDDNQDDADYSSDETSYNEPTSDSDDDYYGWYATSDISYENTVSDGDYTIISDDTENSEGSISYSSVDNTELTSEDWEKIRRGETSDMELSVSTSGEGDFRQIKEASQDVNENNDTWVFLVTGISMVGVGIIILIAVIAYSVYTKKRSKKANEKILSTLPPDLADKEKKGELKIKGEDLDPKK